MKTIRDLFKQERDDWLDSARVTAKKLLKRRAYITIEDVLEKCPRPSYIHHNSTGRVFTNEFVAVGWRRSERPLMNGRQVRVWKLRDGQ